MRNLLLLGSIFSALTANVSNARAQENCAPLRYDNADIRAFVDEIALRTGRTFLLDPAVSGSVTIKSPPDQGVCAAEAWDLLQAVLRINNFTATPFGDNKYRIIPLQEASRTAGPVNERQSGSGLVTEIVRLRYVDAREAASNLAQVVGQSGVISPVRSGNSIILVDTADNVARLTKILKSLDQDQTVYKTIPLAHASAGDISRVVSELASELSDDSNGGRGSFSVAPIDASNSLLVRAEPTLMRRIEQVVAELDQFGESSSELAVVYLNHADAEELAVLLSNVANNVSNAGQGDANSGAQGASRVSVSPYPAANAIIINGSADIQRTLQNVIAKLDIRRPQVLVEAIIVDISEITAREIGVQYFLTGSEGSGIPFSATNFDSAQPNILAAAGSALLQSGSFPTGLTEADSDATASTLAQTALTSLLGVNGLALGGGTSFGENNFFGAILTAIKTDTKSDILSTPSVVTLDNQLARLQVGQEVPVTTGEAVGDDFTNAFRTVDRQEIGVILEVTPQINEGDSVTLEIRQETSSIIGTSSTTSTDLILDKREISTTALVDNGEILVIGGLIDSATNVVEEKIPLLGDVPVVGNLFKNSDREVTKRNLLVFIRPTILRDDVTAAAATSKKLDYVRARDLLSGGNARAPINSLIDDVTGIYETPRQQIPAVELDQQNETGPIEE